MAKDKEQNRIVLFRLTAGGGREVSMADLHRAPSPNSNVGIDAVGWLFSAVAAAITTVAALIAYGASDTMVAPAPVSQVVAR
jgi:hypothetical protein